MPRQVKDTRLQTRSARSKLKRQPKPYYREIDPGIHLGYRRGQTGGRWVVRWYAGAGAYKVETIGTADDNADADAETVLDYRQAQERARRVHLERTSTSHVKTTDRTVGAVVQAYIELARIHRKTPEEMQRNFDAHIKPALGNVKVEELATKQIRDFHHKLAKTPPRRRTRAGEKQRYGPLDTSDPEAMRRRKVTANRVLALLRAALNWAWEEGAISSRDAWARVKPFKEVTAARPDYFEVDEVRRLVNAANPDFRPLVRAAVLTGCRYGELYRLRVGDYVAEAGGIHIRNAKSGKDRYVYLDDQGVALFEELIAGRQADAFMFVKATGGRWGKSHQLAPMRDACTRAGIPPVGFHTFRHTYCSHAIMNGAPLMVVATSLGHADTRMIEKNYGHLADSYVADTIRRAVPDFGIAAPSKVTRLRTGAK